LLISFPLYLPYILILILNQKIKIFIKILIKVLTIHTDQYIIRHKIKIERERGRLIENPIGGDGPVEERPTRKRI